MPDQLLGLSRSERAAWVAQRAFRRWSVFFAINAVALIWLALGGQTWWNYTWSALAVDVEFVTALAVVSLGQRDHQLIVHINAVSDKLDQALGHQEEILEKMAQLEEQHGFLLRAIADAHGIDYT